MRQNSWESVGLVIKCLVSISLVSNNRNTKVLAEYSNSLYLDTYSTDDGNYQRTQYHSLFVFKDMA